MRNDGDKGMTGWIEIGSPALTAAINPLGAELSSLRDAGGRELMTDADPAFWAGRAPLLFPVVGRLVGDRYRLDGTEYAMPKHGFARRQPFEVVECSATEVTLRLSDSEETRALYPFAFGLVARFAIEDASLMIEVTIINTGVDLMPASFGFHPALAWPLPFGEPREAHRISFRAAQPRPLRAITPEGQIAPGLRASPLTHDRHLALADDLFVDDALVWDPVEGDSVTYGASKGPKLEVAFPGADALGIWTRPGARFVCIEPWNGVADPEGFAGQIWDKPGMMRLRPGEQRTFRMSVALIA